MEKLVPIYCIQNIIAESVVSAKTPADAHHLAYGVATELEDDVYTEVEDFDGGIQGSYAWDPNVKFTKRQRERYKEILDAAYMTYVARHIGLQNAWDIVYRFPIINSSSAEKWFSEMRNNKAFIDVCKENGVNIWMSKRSFEQKIFKEPDYQKIMDIYVPTDMMDDFINLAFASIPDATDKELEEYYSELDD